MRSFARRGARALLAVLAGALPAGAQMQQSVGKPAGDERLVVLDVPYIAQTVALCGGAAVAMLLRYWGERDVRAEDFTSLLNAAGDGILAADLVDAVRARGWTAHPFAGDAETVRTHIASGRPVIALIEVAPTTYHYVVLVAWAEDGVLLHDPALAPFRSYAAAEFTRAWAATGYWSLLVQPAAQGDRPPSRPPIRLPVGEASNADVPADCSDWLEPGVDAARRRDLDTADRMLDAAAARCPGSARVAIERAGLRFLQERYEDAAALAEAALETEPQHAHAARLMAASRFMLGDDMGALDAWNLAGMPVLDITTIDGLARMRFQVVANAIGIAPGQTITSASLRLARRRVLALPAVQRARVDFLPRDSGLAEIDAAITERAPFPRAWPDLAVLAGRTIANREIQVDLTGIAGAGERWRLQWRWGEARPARGVSLALPGPSGVGVWEISGRRSTESYALPSSPAAHAVTRRTFAVQLSDWATAESAWSIAASADHWRGRGTFGGLELSGGTGTTDDAFRIDANVAAWAGSATPFGRAALHARARIPLSGAFEAAFSSTFGHTLGDVPTDLWYGAGTGRARDPLLRAHPLLDRHDRISSEFLAPAIVTTTVELRRWLFEPFPGLRLGVAGFLDAAAVLRSTPPRNALDGGAGVRIRFADAGTLRLDLAAGITEPARAFSISFEPPTL